MNENGGGSQGGKDVSLDDLFGENLGANARRSAEAEGDHNKAELMGRVTCSDDEEAEVEVEDMPCFTNPWKSNRRSQGRARCKPPPPVQDVVRGMCGSSCDGGAPQTADRKTHRLRVRF